MKKLLLLSICLLSACSTQKKQLCNTYSYQNKTEKINLFIQKNGQIEKEEFTKSNKTSHKGLYRLEGDNLIVYIKDSKNEYTVKKEKKQLIEKHTKNEFICQ